MAGAIFHFPGRRGAAPPETGMPETSHRRGAALPATFPEGLEGCGAAEQDGGTGRMG